MGGMGVGWEVEVGMGGAGGGAGKEGYKDSRVGEGLLLWWVGWDGMGWGFYRFRGVGGGRDDGILDE